MTRLFIILLSVFLVSCTSIAENSAPLDNEEISFYIEKLPDRDFVDVYGDDENPKTWYTAAEKLGQMGADAIPALVRRLTTTDAYELMLALYALMLASQDPVIMQKTGNDYLQLDTVLTTQTNAINLKLAQQWCRRHTEVCNTLPEL